MSKENVENFDYNNVFVKTEQTSDVEIECEEEHPEYDIVKVEIKNETEEYSSIHYERYFFVGVE